uniref:Uncharacterized protein n=1 Tax=Coccidioides posadasii RMSCC 3488 TaxID=454284 RepID=A0A0J6FEB7_COCPO|nr:hypothetical protein CPAG_04968 [Coccidioides posadasii RMSCC 3488]
MDPTEQPPSTTRACSSYRAERRTYPPRVSHSRCKAMEFKLRSNGVFCIQTKCRGFNGPNVNSSESGWRPFQSSQWSRRIPQEQRHLPSQERLWTAAIYVLKPEEQRPIIPPTGRLSRELRICFQGRTTEKGEKDMVLACLLPKFAYRIPSSCDEPLT